MTVLGARRDDAGGHLNGIQEVVPGRRQAGTAGAGWRRGYFVAM